MIRFSSVIFGLLTSLTTFAGTPAPVCVEQLWPGAGGKVATAAQLGFVLRGFETATVAVHAKAGAPRALPGVDGVNAPADLVKFKDGAVTAVFAGPAAALLAQAAAFTEVFPDAHFTIAYGVRTGEPLDLAAKPKRSAGVSVTGASLASILRDKTAVPVEVAHLKTKDFYYAFRSAQLAALDEASFAALQIEILPGPLAKLGELPAGAWIVRTDAHVVASSAAASILFKLAEVDVAQSQSETPDELRARIDQCLNLACSPREAWPQLSTAPQVIEYLALRFKTPVADHAAEMWFDKMYEIHAPGQTRAAPLGYNDAALVLNEKFNMKAAKGRVMTAWAELEAKIALATPPTPPTPPVPPTTPAPKKAKPRAKVAKTKSPVKSSAKPVTPAATAAPETPAKSTAAATETSTVVQFPTSAHVFPDIRQDLSADGEQETADVARFRNFLTAGLDQSTPGRANDPLSVESENAIIDFLQRFEGTKGMNTATSFTKAFSSVFFALKKRALSQKEYADWRFQLMRRATEFSPRNTDKTSPRAGLGIAWRMVQLAINDPGAHHAISVASVRATEALIYGRLQTARPESYFKKRVN